MEASAPEESVDLAASFETLDLGKISLWACGTAAGPRMRTDWFDAQAELRFRRQDGPERDATILKVARILQDESLAVSGAHRLDAWRRGWGEILERARAGELRYEALSPQYFKFDVARIDGDFATLGSPRFEFALCHAFKAALYDRWLDDGGRLVDLGSGTAANLVLLARMFPNAEIVGADWAEPAVELADLVGALHGGRVRGARFDMLSLEGREGLDALKDAAVVSVHAFEQLGEAWGPLLEMLVAARPALCVQVEPIAEFYDEHDRPDPLLAGLGRLYHRKRGYLSGYLTALRALAREGRVEILEARRAPVGTMVHEPYGVVVWRPL